MKYIYKKAIGHLHSFIKNSDGVSAILFAVTTPAILLAAGMAVDLGMAYHNQHKLQYAIDTATLSGNVVDREDDAALTEFIQNVAVRNFNNNAFASLDPNDVNVDLSDETKIKVSASILNKNIFAPVFMTNVETSSVGAYTEAKKPLDGLEIALVLDNSYSMKGSKITGLQDAAHGFVDTIMTNIPDGNEIKIAIVPYSVGINVGFYGSHPSRDINGDIYSGSAFTSFNSGDVRTYTNLESSFRNPDKTYNETLWNGCVYEYGLGEYGINGHIPSWKKYHKCFGPDGSRYSSTTYNAPSGVVYLDTDFETTAANEGLSATEVWQSCKLITDTAHNDSGGTPSWYGAGTCLATSTTTVIANIHPQCNGPADYQHFTAGKDPVAPDPGKMCNFDGVDIPCPTVGSAAKDARIDLRYYNPNATCNHAPIIPLQSSATMTKTIDNLEATIDDMEHAPSPWTASTYTDVGMAWAYHTLSPDHPFEEAAEFDDIKWLKSVILMSDGLIQTSKSVYKWSPYLDTGTDSNESELLFTQMCEKIKAENVEIYTIQFGEEMNTDPDAKNDFVNCASDSDNFYYAVDNDDLEEVFQEIAESLGKSRLLE